MCRSGLCTTRTPTAARATMRTSNGLWVAVLALGIFTTPSKSNGRAGARAHHEGAHRLRKSRCLSGLFVTLTQPLGYGPPLHRRQELLEDSIDDLVGGARALERAHLAALHVAVGLRTAA